MTRRTLKRKLRTYVLILLLIIIIAAVAKFEVLSHYVRLEKVYEFINDMSLLIFTIGAAYLANVFQQRSNFLSNLKEEWHEIVRAKSSLILYINNQHRTNEDYLAAYQHLSQCIDYMRIVYRNVGETKTLIGKYPYEPLHDMRRAMNAIDPRKAQVTDDDLEWAYSEVWEAFNALRERFLEELDLEEPENPLIMERARRTKKEGADI